MSATDSAPDGISSTRLDVIRRRSGAELPTLRRPAPCDEGVDAQAVALGDEVGGRPGRRLSGVGGYGRAVRSERRAALRIGAVRVRAHESVAASFAVAAT